MSGPTVKSIACLPDLSLSPFQVTNTHVPTRGCGQPVVDDSTCVLMHGNGTMDVVDRVNLLSLRQQQQQKTCTYSRQNIHVTIFFRGKVVNKKRKK
jgi:hypothetical protein